MRQTLNWQGCRAGEEDWFPVSVPGDIQQDYGKYKNFPDIHFGKNVEMYQSLEDDAWLYRAAFDAPSLNPGHRLFFVSEGIEYAYEIRCNGRLLLEHEGMFTRVELDLTDCLLPTGNRLEIKILPHPTGGHPRGIGRDEADHSCKPAVEYGWDWRPRLLTSGMWQEAWLETRGPAFLRSCSVSYTLNPARDEASVRFAADCDDTVTICLRDREDNIIYQGTHREFTVKNPRLWWCNGQGEPYLYSYTVSSKENQKEGCIGFRTVELTMNEGAWEQPSEFPKSRSVPPITLRLNGRRIFAKGSNWVTPELFSGTAGPDTYAPLLERAKDAHMNILRCWGGSEIYKESFYTLCDRLGIMVWQEFPLACNLYPDDEKYLAVLEQEARAIIQRLRQHPSLTLWCGGNELFNNWSGMTDQSLPLRLLNRLCYELDLNTPFLMTSPLMGMGHGGYLFYMKETGKDVFETFQESRCTAYTEFGVPGIADPEYLETFIPREELFPPEPGGVWEKHHGFHAWQADTWVCRDILERCFGPADSLETLCVNSQWLQCEGYKAAFEEARRQWPACSMALNWCYNEPWKTAANNSLLSYPALPKPGYHAVKSALRPVMPSARIPKFAWQEGELFTAELWLLNDSPEPRNEVITAYLELDGERQKLLCWETGVCAPNSHKQGHKIQMTLPKLMERSFILLLESGCGRSAYQLLYTPKAPRRQEKVLNL